MFAKKKKAKKNINALVLASVAAGSIIFPGLINAISSLRLAETKGKTEISKNQASASLVKNRAQSLGALEFQKQQQEQQVKSSSSTLYDEIAPAVSNIRGANFSSDSINSNGTASRFPKSHFHPGIHQIAPQPQQLSLKKSVNFSFSSNNNTIIQSENTATQDIAEEDWDAEFQAQSNSNDNNNNNSEATTGSSSTNISKETDHANPPLPPFRRKPPTQQQYVARAGGPHHQRRVVSAPSVTQTRFLEGDSALFGSSGSGGLVDALWDDNDDDEEFLVASVKQKVVSRREKDLERSVSANVGLESWDDDFLEDSSGGCRWKENEGIKIPNFVGEVQESLKIEAENFRKFSLHIEDLKLIYMDAIDISFGLEFSCPEQILNLTPKYQKMLDTAKVLIHLGDFDENKEEQMLSDDFHLSILSELLGDFCGNSAEIRALALSKHKMLFAGEYVPILIKNIGTVKQQLNQYLLDMRVISREHIPREDQELEKLMAKNTTSVVTREQMEKEIAAGLFIESAQFSGNYYGTSYRAIQDVLAANKSPILDIDMQGVKILQNQLAKGEVRLSAKPLFIFLAPPSVEELEKRLTGRGTETKESLAARLAAAKAELVWGLGGNNGLDYTIINDDFEVAYTKLKKILVE
ncbi:hypothetical protein HK100_004209 [Physocladia obscura]|uniref:Guanylate kinase-like domain-containing protein n=1 Tax=Physocladia obscura TaxID=109957 RepID=A0AAD5XDZ6_9FUNG|nr:hypothetical protein HK100_004209 [Physocladia obscura]